jgi:hypothetical protein
MEKIMRYNLQFITPISVDKIEIRNRILKSSLNIRYVPSILIFSKTNTELLESEKAALFIESIVNKIEMQNNPSPQEEETKPKSILKKEKNNATSIDDLIDEDESEPEDEDDVDEKLERRVRMIENSRNKLSRKKPVETQSSTYTEETIEKALNEKKVDIGKIAKQMEDLRNNEFKEKKPTVE